MSKFSKIRLNFDVLKNNYYSYDRLPQAIQKYMDGLNDPIKKRIKIAIDSGLPPPVEKLNTPCVIQVSHAFNATNHKIPASSFWRANPVIPGGNGNYLQAVNELESYLVSRYGGTEDIKATQGGDVAKMKKHIGGKQGLLIFGEAHTEFWNQSNILQSGGGAGGMNQSYIWSRAKVLFWEIGEESAAQQVPIWLQGWWTVYDGNYYYYYFSDQLIVTYTKAKPSSPVAAPPRAPMNEGKVTMTEHGLVIDWNPADGGATKETFTRLGWTSEREMNGVSNRYAPLFARKMM
jgi:hypothetical protein